MTFRAVHTPVPSLGHRSRVWVASFLMAAFLFAAGSTSYRDAAASELALKAKFTIELALFIKFPKQKDPATPFTIAVVGESPFHDELEAYAKGRRIQGRAIRILKTSRIPVGQECDLLFLCRSEWPRARGILAWTRNQGILTVAEGREMASLGVMVNLLVEDNALRIGLNRRALEAEGFRVGALVDQIALTLVPSETPHSAVAASPPGASPEPRP